MEYLEQLGVPTIILYIFILLAAIKFSIDLVDWVKKRFGIETKWDKKNNTTDKKIAELYEAVENLKKDLEDYKKENYEQQLKRREQSFDIQKQLTENQKELSTQLSTLQDMMLDKQIDDMRWSIINLATKVSEGKPCNKDSYQHCFKIYKKYEDIIAANHMTNNEVDISMEIIKKSYKEKLLNGAFTEK